MPTKKSRKKKKPVLNPPTLITVDLNKLTADGYHPDIFMYAYEDAAEDFESLEMYIGTDDREWFIGVLIDNRDGLIMEESFIRLKNLTELYKVIPPVIPIKEKNATKLLRKRFII